MLETVVGGRAHLVGWSDGARGSRKRGEEFIELSTSGGGAQTGARVYRVGPEKVIVFGGEHGQTKYTF